MIGGLTTVAGAGVATGIILPKTLKLKDGIGSFVPGAGEANYESFKNGVNYVALGDSETAGYNGFMHDASTRGLLSGGGGDYLSYADFLAHDLSNANKLISYHNYAKTGATIGEQQQLFGESMQIHDVLKNANLITATIGANDLLAFVKLLALPFSNDLMTLLSKAVSGKLTTPVEVNNIRDQVITEAAKKADSIINQRETKSHEGLSSKEIKELVKKSIIMLADMAKSKDFSHFIDIEEGYKDIIFDLLKRNIMMFIHDLREIAPKAQILILGHAMPFAQ